MPRGHDVYGLPGLQAMQANNENMLRAMTTRAQLQFEESMQRDRIRAQQQGQILGLASRFFEQQIDAGLQLERDKQQNELLIQRDKAFSQQRLESQEGLELWRIHRQQDLDEYKSTGLQPEEIDADFQTYNQTHVVTGKAPPLTRGQFVQLRAAEFAQERELLSEQAAANVYTQGEQDEQARLDSELAKVQADPTLDATEKRDLVAQIKLEKRAIRDMAVSERAKRMTGSKSPPTPLYHTDPETGVRSMHDGSSWKPLTTGKAGARASKSGKAGGGAGLGGTNYNPETVYSDVAASITQKLVDDDGWKSLDDEVESFVEANPDYPVPLDNGTVVPLQQVMTARGGQLPYALRMRLRQQVLNDRIMLGVQGIMGAAQQDGQRQQAAAGQQQQAAAQQASNARVGKIATTANELATSQPAAASQPAWSIPASMAVVTQPPAPPAPPAKRKVSGAGVPFAGGWVPVHVEGQEEPARKPTATRPATQPAAVKAIPANAADYQKGQTYQVTKDGKVVLYRVGPDGNLYRVRE